MNDNKNKIVLKIGGNSFSGWKSVEISHSINKISPSFAMSYTDNYPNKVDDRSFRLGQEAFVEINGYRLVTGWIEEIRSDYNYVEKRLEIRGRDKIGDLIDCSNWGPTSKNEFFNQTILNIIKALCKPFSISVLVDDSAAVAVQKKAAADSWKTKEGDTIFDSILRLCRMNAILPIGYGDGKITLTRTSTKKANDSLELGKNILAGTSENSNIERFSDYIIKGTGNGSDDFSEVLETVTGPSAVATDALITRHRPLVIITDDVVNEISQLQDKAKWEALTRAGFSRRYEYKVNGWIQQNGEPWMINSLVKINDTISKVQGTLLITDITYLLSNESGMISQITVMSPDAFKLLSLAEKIKSSADNYDISGLMD